MVHKVKEEKKGCINFDTPSFLSAVITDDFQNCGDHPDSLQTWLMPDIIGDNSIKADDPMYGKSAWCTIEIPQNIKAGSYKLNLLLQQDGKTVSTIPFIIKVLNRKLTLSDNFHLNFWQQPYAVSRYYGVAPWSQAHLDILRPYMQLLARAGQRNASAILFYEPWGVQSNDKFDAMIETTRKADGTWSYDYTAFDRWISFLDSCGINGDINCFSMVPWDMTFTFMMKHQKAIRNLKRQLTAKNTATYGFHSYVPLLPTRRRKVGLTEQS